MTPGRILPDSAIVAAATAMPGDRRTLLRTQGFHGRGAARYAAQWAEALNEVAALPEEELPTRAPRGDGPPLPRAWSEKDPVAARRLTAARDAVTSLSGEIEVPAENILTPDHLRRLLWTPPSTRDPEPLAEAVDAQLAGYGARAWQRGLTVPLLVKAIIDADTVPEPEPEPSSSPRRTRRPGRIRPRATRSRPRRSAPRRARARSATARRSAASARRGR